MKPTVLPGNIYFFFLVGARGVFLPGSDNLLPSSVPREVAPCTTGGLAFLGFLSLAINPLIGRHYIEFQALFPSWAQKLKVAKFLVRISLPKRFSEASNKAQTMPVQRSLPALLIQFPHGDAGE